MNENLYGEHIPRQTRLLVSSAEMLEAERFLARKVMSRIVFSDQASQILQIRTLPEQTIRPHG